MPVSKSRYRRNDAWGPTWFTPYSMPNCKCGEVHSLVVVFPSKESYWTHSTGAIPGLSGLGSQWDYSRKACAELAVSKTDCDDWSSRGGARRVWDGVLPYRHVAVGSNRRGMRESENGRMGVTLKPLVPVYNTQLSSVVIWVACSRRQVGCIVRNILCGWTLWSHRSKCPQQIIQEVGDTKPFRHTSSVEGIHHPTPALQGSGVTKQFVKG